MIFKQTDQGEQHIFVFNKNLLKNILAYELFPNPKIEEKPTFEETPQRLFQRSPTVGVFDIIGKKRKLVVISVHLKAYFVSAEMKAGTTKLSQSEIEVQNLGKEAIPKVLEDLRVKFPVTDKKKDDNFDGKTFDEGNLIVILGDFNTDPKNEEAFKPIKDLGFEYIGDNIPTNMFEFLVGKGDTSKVYDSIWIANVDDRWNLSVSDENKPQSSYSCKGNVIVPDELISAQKDMLSFSEKIKEVKGLGKYGEAMVEECEDGIVKFIRANLKTRINKDWSDHKPVLLEVELPKKEKEEEEVGNVDVQFVIERLQVICNDAKEDELIEGFGNKMGLG